MTVPLLTLNNGVKMPALGLGVFLSPPEQTAKAVETAITCGYRLVDTAAKYVNEEQVGEGLRHSGIERSEMFVTTKLWMTDYGYDQALKAFDVSLHKLGLKYVDMYMIHWPYASSFDKTVEAYRALEKLLADGKTRAIGVCNFNVNHLKNLIERTRVIPAVNQVELHPFFIQRELREFDTKHGIVTQSWSPIGGVFLRKALRDPSSTKHPLRDPAIIKLAEKYGKTPAQIVLRWHIEHGLSAIPKSVRSERIAENIDIFDFSLSREDVAIIDNLDTGARTGHNPETVDPATFGFRVEK